jgi:Family of unknown function (DUF6299)
MKLKLILTTAIVGAALALPGISSARAQAPPNDTFEQATVISSLPFLQTLTTSAATTDSTDAEALAACGLLPPVPPLAASVWYVHTPLTDRVVTVDTFGSSYTTGVAVVTGSPGSLSAVSCFAVIGRFTPVPGDTYYIGISDITGGHGGSLNVSVTAPELGGTVDQFGRIDPQTGEATLTGTITCMANLSGDVFLTLTQRSGQTTVTGSGSTTLICNGREQTWSITFQPTGGSFKNGHATVAGQVAETAFPLPPPAPLEESVVLHRR